MVELVSECETRYPQGVHVGIGQAGVPEKIQKVLDAMMKEAYPWYAPLAIPNINILSSVPIRVMGTKGLGIVPVTGRFLNL